MDCDTSTDMNRGWDDIVGTLAHIDMIIRMHSNGMVSGNMSNHFIAIHITAGTRTCLENVDWKMRIHLSVRDLLSSANNGLSNRLL